MKIFSGPHKSRKPGEPARKKILFVSHEATRTGAPKIILNILRHFSENCDIHCETVLHNGGHLAAEFENYSNVSCLNLARKQTEELQRKVRKIVHKEKHNPPILAIGRSVHEKIARFMVNGVVG